MTGKPRRFPLVFVLLCLRGELSAVDFGNLPFQLEKYQKWHQDDVHSRFIDHAKNEDVHHQNEKDSQSLKLAVIILFNKICEIND